MLWACILLPQLALDGVLRRHATPDQALVLVDGPVQRRMLRAVNAAARAEGLRAGMPLATAQAICARFAVVEHDPADTARWHDFLAAWAYRYGAQVSRQLPASLLIEVAASFRLFGEWPRMETLLREDLSALGFRHRLALAPNPWAARALAGVHDGLAITHDAPLQQAIGQLPVERAGLPPEAANSLRRMGLRRLAQVYALPRAALGRRVGTATLDQLDRLTGALATPLDCYQPPDHFESRIEFNYEVGATGQLLFPLRRMVSDLAVYLAGRDGGVQRFVLRLEHERGGATEVPVGLLAPERDAAMLFELARGRLDLVQLAAPVRALQLVARELPPFVPAGRDLFDVRPQQAVPWEQLRERLRARLGDEAVHGLAVHADHRPECAWRDHGDSAPAPTLPRPGWLLPQPIPLRERVLRILAGPERIESGWWNGDVRRDYYVVETGAGQRAWAYCPAGERDGFMLHGWFA